MKKFQLSVLISSTAILSIALVLVFYSFFKVVHIEEIGMDITVGDHIGMNSDNDALHFGMVMKGACAHRNIIVKHEFDFPVKVSTRISGELGKWTLVDNNNQVIKNGEEIEVSFHVCPPREAEYEDYTGTARVFFERV